MGVRASTIHRNAWRSSNCCGNRHSCLGRVVRFLAYLVQHGCGKAELFLVPRRHSQQTADAAASLGGEVLQRHQDDAGTEKAIEDDEPGGGGEGEEEWTRDPNSRPIWKFPVVSRVRNTGAPPFLADARARTHVLESRSGMVLVACYATLRGKPRSARAARCQRTRCTYRTTSLLPGT